MTEKEFNEKYCKGCSSLVCTGTEEEAAKGCKDYQKEVLGWQELKDFKVHFKVPKIELEKFSVELKLGNLSISLKDVTFTKRQIKNYKKYFNIEARNLDGQVDKK